MTDFTNNRDLSIHSREWVSQSMTICNGLRRTKCRTVHDRRREVRWYLPGEKINKPVLGKHHFLHRTYNERGGCTFHLSGMWILGKSHHKIIPSSDTMHFPCAHILFSCVAIFNFWRSYHCETPVLVRSLMLSLVSIYKVVRKSCYRPTKK